MGEFEFPTMGHIWLAQRARGADVSFVPAEGNRIPATNYEKMIDRETLIVPLTQVCFKNGFRSEVGAITQIAHRAGALVMLDDYQDCGTRPVDVKAMDLDFYVTGTLKYLLGPPGLAFMYVRKNLIQSLVPTITGWFAQTNPFAFDPQNLNLSPTARRFESGSPSVPNVYAAMPGIPIASGNRHGKRGRPRQEPYPGTVTLVAALDIRVKTPADSAGPLVVLQANDSSLLLQKLAENGIVASNRHDGLRISFHVYNTMDDVKAVVEVLKTNINLLVRENARVGSHD